MNDASSAEVLTDSRDSVCTITLNAPARRNALSPSMRVALRAALKAAMEDRAVRVVVLTGAAGTFTAGGDIQAMTETTDPQSSREKLIILHDCVRLIVNAPKPVIAAVEGFAFGAGFSLACAADCVIASRGASFSAAFGKIGLVADCGLFWTLPQRSGLGLTRDLLLTGRRVDANEANAVGIVDQLVEDGSALSAAIEKAAQYMAVGPLAIAATKSALARRPTSLEDALAVEADLQAPLRASHDHQEAIKAFLAKRPAVFSGH